jgi:3-oxoacyl-[acyl-carrier protein] reductase
MDLNLSGRRALVCGASQGIGAATAFELASMGCKVTCLARTEEKLQKVLDGLPGDGHHALICDVSDREDLAKKVSDSISENGDFHILICNSGGPKGGPLLESSVETFVSGFENHVLVNMLLTKLVAPGMKKANFGRIVNIISTSVKAPIPNLGVSNTIRGAVANLAKSLSAELAPFGITVNNVLPGYTETPRLEALLSGAAKKTGKSLKDVTEEWRNRVPSKRFGQPEEVASAVAYLASPVAGYISGINIPVDGGRTQSL